MSPIFFAIHQPEANLEPKKFGGFVLPGSLLWQLALEQALRHLFQLPPSFWGIHVGFSGEPHLHGFFSNRAGREVHYVDRHQKMRFEYEKGTKDQEVRTDL